MQHRGLIRRQGCSEDGRGAVIALTQAGRRAIDAAAPGHVQTVRRLLFDGLTPAQITLLKQLSTQVLARLDESADDSGREGNSAAGCSA